MFYCAISGEPPQEPVISTKSGHVYEKRLILKYINENGTDPVTGEKLEENDLVAVKASAFIIFSYVDLCTNQCIRKTLIPLLLVHPPTRPSLRC